MKDWMRWTLAAAFAYLLWSLKAEESPQQTSWGYSCVEGTRHNPSTGFCEPTGVDRQLAQQVQAAPTVSPTPTRSAAWHVDRSWWGSCPNGYVAHPSRPEKCSLPRIAAAILNRAGRNEVTSATPQSLSTSQYHPLDFRNPDNQRARAADAAEFERDELEQKVSRLERLEREARIERDFGER